MTPRQGRIATTQEFLEIVNNPQIQTIIIVSHILLENLIDLAIYEILAHKHLVELRRVPFPLKLDLAIALRLFSIESRPAYLKFNSLRNRFAHDWTSEFTEQDATDFRNCLSARQRYMLGNYQCDSPVGHLRRYIAVLEAELHKVVSDIRDEKVRSRVIHEMVEKITLTPPGPNPVSARIEEKVSEERKKREAAGDL